MAPSAVDAPTPPLPAREERTYPPARIFNVKETKFTEPVLPQPDGREKALARPDGEAAIVIDNGSSTVRAGWSFESTPRVSIPPIMAKYRDRKLGKTYSFAGYDCYAETNAKGHIRNAFELGTGIVSNWDVEEHVLDWTFLKLGMNDAEGAIDLPIVMTEAVANLPYSRKSMNEIIFECYGAPSLATGIDSLFSYRYNNGQTGLVVSSSYSSTHIIPVYNSKAMLAQAIRLNWGGWHAAEYLLKLMRLKYPAFTGKLNASQAEHMLRDHCYVSKAYNDELRTYLDWTGLEDRDVVMQYPFTEEIVVQKSEEELARIAERKKESGRRLQEQAAKMRLEKLIRKEKELEYYKKLAVKLADANKKDTKRLLDAEDMKDEAQLERTIKELDKSIRRARTKDVGGDPEEEQEAPDFSLLEVPDDQLDEAGLKAKRHQRLLKSNHEARARAKAEKEAEKARVAEEERLDRERRENDLERWLEEKRIARENTLQKIKERERLKADLGNRKSLASQMRMKSIANLASDNPRGKRRRGGDDDNFGANDDDWGVYRQIAVGEGSDEEEGEEDLGVTLAGLEEDLLRYDPNFTHEHTWEAQNDWNKSLLHAFMRGPRPFDASSQAEIHQMHLNVERIRVPEVVFQPSIAGVDQAGLIEITGDILTQRLVGLTGVNRNDFLRDIFLTGGNTLYENFDHRLREGLTPLLLSDSPLKLRKAGDALLDAWRGAAQWVGTPAWKAATVTKAEFQEKGQDYMKPHHTYSVPHATKWENTDKGIPTQIYAKSPPPSSPPLFHSTALPNFSPHMRAPSLLRDEPPLLTALTGVLGARHGQFIPVMSQRERSFAHPV
ncbi:putative chromatin remodeling complex subunit [Xylaria intraflava]|nr:putative chromatin remodeling complex subunit [Xylaria intraflava]